jgi:hypothetical protein
MKYTAEIASCGIIPVPSFLKIGTGVQAILRFFLRNLRGCNVGITDGRNFFLITPLRCRDIRTKFDKDWFRHSKVNWGGIHRQQGDLLNLLLFVKNKESGLKRSSSFT